MKEGSAENAILRTDYRPWPFRVSRVDLDFDIREDHTCVRATMDIERNPDAEPSDVLELSGKALETVALAIDGRALGEDEWRVHGETLAIAGVPEAFTLTSEVRIRPAENTALEGLYASGAFLLTQCEAEGFRKITWFPDRPDVMTRFRVRIEADRARYPVLLSNGNLVEHGEAGEGRHWVAWEDPFPKPSYLFALVAGDLAHVEEHFTTRGGRRVTLRVYVEHENVDRCEHAMDSLKRAMRWDEDRFGLEYDLDIYNIVATNDFNMGAMENKSLNIFNSKYVLARPDTATDADYQGIEGVIGHEYFHNWTGNRVTCRDWFQLTLKEGLTVFRDEEFSSDMGSRAVKRICDVRDLRNRQFPEDAGPMAHPIRPDRYVEVNNFYTATVYQKGAAVIRMIHTLLGEDGFQAGMRLYFERHDGQAVTCDDFVAAMADANGRDLSHFSRWYGQSGTPEVTVRSAYDAEARTCTLHFSQRTPPTPDQEDKRALTLPCRLGLLSADGRALPLRMTGEAAGDAPTERLLVIEDEEASFTFEDIDAPPVPSLFRDFSAPVKLRYDYRGEELATLMAHDSDPFARWEAAQQMTGGAILAQVARRAAGDAMELDATLVDAFERLVADRAADPALLAEALALPSEDYLAEQMEVVDVDGIHAARDFVRRGLAVALEATLAERYAEADDGGAYDKAPESMARRALRNACLSYLVRVPGGAALAERQLERSDNMTDTLAALVSLVYSDAEAAPAALAAFESRWSGDALVMDKWFAIQAMKPGASTLARVRALMEHPEFSLRNPNKVRSLVGAFAMANPTAFHAADGEGYAFHAEQVMALNDINPQIAARMAGAFNRWKRYDPARQASMRAALERVAAHPGLSPDVSEIVTSALR